MAEAQCAYCGKVAPLTKEHIWPQCIIKREPTLVMRYSAKAQKVFGGDLIVSDVCAPCNNGPLSTLDEYACGLHDRYFSKIVNPADRVAFHYDQNLLIRWLLKVSYNSSRTTGEDADFHTPLVPFMMGDSAKPAFVSVMLDIVTPSVVNGVTLEPKATRCGRVFVGRSRPWICVRLVAVNSYYFYVLITAEEPTVVPDDELIECRLGIKGKLVGPTGKLVLTKHKSDFYEMHAPHILKDRALYADFVARYRRMH